MPYLARHVGIFKKWQYRKNKACGSFKLMIKIDCFRYELIFILYYVNKDIRYIVDPRVLMAQ